MNTRERYDSLDGLRVISCFAIIAMHIRANSQFDLAPWLKSMLASWSLFVYLFLLISGFGMFCGYYERFKDGGINLESFYKRRYSKIVPFFAFLILIDIVIDRSLLHLIEGLTEVTMVFGLLPNNSLDVIGVSWTLGVIFLFYMLFPFAVFLCWNKKRAWVSLALAIMINIACSYYFFTEKFVISSFVSRHSFLYCAPFFLAGGILFLYRKEVQKTISSNRWICLGICVAITALYYILIHPRIDMNDPGPWMLLLFMPWLAYAISVKSRILSNRGMKYLSNISMEMYLAHMVVFRVIEKAKCLYLFGNGIVGFIALWVMVVICLILFIQVSKWLLNKGWQIIQKGADRRENQ